MFASDAISSEQQSVYYLILRYTAVSIRIITAALHQCGIHMHLKVTEIKKKKKKDWKVILSFGALNKKFLEVLHAYFYF